jgi:short subunit dehydrogenase-like uncharacterized protein
LNLVEEARADRDVRRLLADPYALNPADQRHGPDGPDQGGARFDPELGFWTGPFVMAAINTRVVRRSNALLEWRYGREFRYSEVVGFGRGVSGRMAATAMAGGLAAFVAGAAFAPSRALLQRTVLPSPGEGPSREARERGFFEIKLHGFGTDPSGERVRSVGRVEGTRDPGYGETAKMLGESALCLACDELPTPGGVLTPASAMGMQLVERLRNAGMVFDVTTVD